LDPYCDAADARFKAIASGTSLLNNLQTISFFSEMETSMKSMRLALVAMAALGIALGSNAFAASGAVNAKINQLFFYEGHNGLLVVLASMTDLGGCGNANYFLLPQTHVHYKEVVALLLTAKAMDSTVGVHVVDCFEGYGRIKHVSLIS
jgi:hypothetical protein